MGLGFKGGLISEGIFGPSTQGQLQEWTEHSHTDLGKFETSRYNQKIISTSFEHLKICINFQN